MPKVTKILILLLIATAVIFPRILDLDAFETADEKRWVSNTVGFVSNLAHGEWGHLMQQPHPGITTQWLGSSTIFSDSWTVRKLPLVLGQSVLLLFICYVFWRLTNTRTALFIILLLALNPLLIAHTRVYAMDSLLSLFLVLSIPLLLLWHQSKSWRYLFLSAFAAAAAILSKISGIIIVPFVFILLIAPTFKKVATIRPSFKSLVLWLVSFLISLMIILPSFALNTREVVTDILTWLKSDDYMLHQIGPWYYLRTIIFFSTPLHLFALLIAPFFLFSKKIPSRLKIILLVFLIFALLFTIQMSLGSKKGDRYILPVFLCLDIVTALVATYIFSSKGRYLPLLIAKLSIAGLVILQAGSLFSLHPHYLSYVNPITQSFFGERRLGWGEGLDLAADYINEMPGASELTVASYYPNEFANYFTGHAVPAHQHDHANVDYVVVYRAMFERGENAWETDVVNIYRPLSPVKIISISSTSMAWIYEVGE